MDRPVVLFMLLVLPATVVPLSAALRPRGQRRRTALLAGAACLCAGAVALCVLYLVTRLSGDEHPLRTAGAVLYVIAGIAMLLGSAAVIAPSVRPPKTRWGRRLFPTLWADENLAAHQKRRKRMLWAVGFSAYGVGAVLSGMLRLLSVGGTLGQFLILPAMGVALACLIAVLRIRPNAR